jgi:hypothetical protein
MALVETLYGDYRFHSRLAARWAVYLDLLGIHFAYRRHSFTLTDLGNREWTPDFCLPQFQVRSAGSDRSDTYLIVAERKPDKWFAEAAGQFASSSPSDEVYIFWGGVGNEGGHSYGTLLKSESSLYPCYFAQCPFCGEFYIADLGRVSDDIQVTAFA